MSSLQKDIDELVAKQPSPNERAEIDAKKTVTFIATLGRELEKEGVELHPDKQHEITLEWLRR